MMELQSRESQAAKRLWGSARPTRTLASVFVMLFALCTPLLASQPQLGWTDAVRTYDVAVQNLTSGQALTPPVVATHNSAAYVFRVGWPASPFVQAIAENGNNTPLLDALADNSDVFESLQAGGADLDPAVAGWDNPVAKITITCIDETARHFATDLSGAAEVPPVFTFATGRAAFVMDLQETRPHYSLDVKKTSGVTQAPIHYSKPNENGPVVVFLYGLSDPLGLTTGKLAIGTITPADLVGPLAGDWAGFVEVLRQGGLYVNVHTADNPPGEIRGQIGGCSGRTSQAPPLAPTGPRDRPVETGR